VQEPRRQRAALRLLKRDAAMSKPRPAPRLRSCVRRVRRVWPLWLLLAAAALLLLGGLSRAAISHLGFTDASNRGINTSVIVNVPAGVVAGDLLLAAVTQDGNGNFTTPAGWTSLLTSDGSRSPRLAIFRRVAGAAEPASYTFTSSRSDDIAGGMMRLRGVDTSNPVAASAILANASSTNCSAPSISPAVTNTLLVGIWATRNAALAPPAAMTQSINASSGAVSGSTYLDAAYQALPASGATGTRVATIAAANTCNGALIALRNAPYTISGSVFEDVHYGGGAGRSRAASGGAAVSGARVELYNGSGIFLDSTTTAADGSYTFTSINAGSYHVRVVGDTVTSTRAGSNASVKGVPSFRTDAGSGAAVAVTDFVGGKQPALADAGNGAAGSVFNTTTGVFSAGPSGTAQAYAPVTVSTANVGSVDFGFTFSTVTNTNDSGPGSLRQAIANANALGNDAALAQAGRSAGIEHLIFMISNGSTGGGGSLGLAGGLRSSINLFSGGVATIATASELPAITTPMVVNAQAQPGWTATPVVRIDANGAGAAARGLVLAAGGSTLRGLAINRADIGIDVTGGSGHVIAGNHVGVDAAGTVASGNRGAGIRIGASGGHTVGGAAAADRNVIGGNGGSGIQLGAGADGTVIAGNHIGTNAAGSAALANQHGIRSASVNGLVIGGAAAAAANVVAGSTGAGLWFDAGNANVSVQGNRIGRNAAGDGALGNGSHGVHVAAGGLVTSTFSGNTIAHNGGAGVALLAGAASQVSLLANRLHDNGGLGIDLGADGVTANDGLTTAGAPNVHIDHPVITGAGVAAAQDSLTAFGAVGTGSGQAAFAGARVEFFKSAVDPSGHGEGQVYLGFLTADANGRFSGSIAFAAGTLAIGDVVTATATDASGNTSEFGPNWTTTTVAALAPAAFNAFETDTAALAINGVIRSKTAGALTSLSVVALNNAGNGLHPSFSGTVDLRWVDARDDSGAASGSCRASWVDLGAAGSVSFDKNARVNVSLTPPASGTRVMRLKMTHSSGATSVTACSTDAFAALPASFTLQASDGDAGSAGSTRNLDNVAANGGVVHRAGRPFSVGSRALDAIGATMTGYDGTPTLAITACLLPAGCTAGALTTPAVSAVAGVYSNAGVSYAEVGSIQLQLTDSTHGAIDAADTPLAARTVQSATLAVGRFVPDSLSVAVSTGGQFATANGACMAAGQGATFIGQGFGWATAPRVTVTARNAAGGTTTLWTGTLMKLAGAAQQPALAVAAAGTAALSTSFGGIAVSDLGGGQARLSASALDRFLLDMPAGSVQPTVVPDWTWSLAVNDASEAGVAGNPTLSATAAQAGVPFDLGAAFHRGRLALGAAHGDARVGVRALVQLQRWTNAGWITLTEDRGCVTVQPQHLAVASPTGVFATLGACAAPVAGAATTAGGRAWLRLPATPGAAPGRLLLRLAGQAAAGNSCNGAGAAALAPMGLPWLLGGDAGIGPAALATWGLPHRDVVLRRETW
jgi:hypothetical protein